MEEKRYIVIGHSLTRAWLCRNKDNQESNKMTLREAKGTVANLRYYYPQNTYVIEELK